MVNVAGAYSAAIILPVVGTIAVSLRLYSKHIRKRLGLDDVLIVIGLILVWGIGITIIVGAATGAVGTHTYVNPVTHLDQATANTVELEKLEFAFWIIERPAFGIVKASVVLWYRRIFVGTVFNILSLATLALLTIWTVGFFFTTAFMCGGNVNYYWESLTLALTKCIDTERMQVAFAVSDVILDILVIALPLPFLWRLRMSREKKIGVTLTLLLGLLSTAAGIVKMVVWINYTYHSVVGHRDFQGLLSTALTWGLVSAGMAVIAACLPTMRPLVNRSGTESEVGAANKAYAQFPNAQNATHPPRAGLGLEDSDIELESRRPSQRP